MAQPEALKLAEELDAYHTRPQHRLAAMELRRLHQHELAVKEFLRKTDWIQESAQGHELGMHRADVLKKRIDTLTEVNQELLAALEKLARLGNGEHYGNSDGNMIARAAIVKAEKELLNL